MCTKAMDTFFLFDRDCFGYICSLVRRWLDIYSMNPKHMYWINLIILYLVNVEESFKPQFLDKVKFLSF